MAEVKFKEIVERAQGRGARVSLKAVRKHGDGFVVQYVVRYAGIETPYYHVGIINSRGHFGGSLTIQ